MSSGWSEEQVPDLSGKVVVVTGANSGIGFDASREFARKGAKVVLACRSQERGQKAVEEIRESLPEAEVELRLLDLADLESVEAFSEGFLEDMGQLDILCNNAGLMALPRCETRQGFEMQFGVNHLGHFALTGRLMPLISETPGARVVTVSSNAHKFGLIRFEDLNWKKRYSKWEAYGQSKLANLLFAFELQRRLKLHGVDAISVGCHPGLTHTELARKGPEMEGSAVMTKLSTFFTEKLGMSSLEGALPTLFAAVEDLQGGEYVGPNGIAEVKGRPEVTEPTKRALNEDDAHRLWQLSETMTDVYYLKK